MSASNKYDDVLPAMAKDFERCNGCDKPFEKRGVRVDIQKMIEHKKGCQEWQKKQVFKPKS